MLFLVFFIFLFVIYLYSTVLGSVKYNSFSANVFTYASLPMMHIHHLRFFGFIIKRGVDIEVNSGSQSQACQVSRILCDFHAFILNHAFTHAQSNLYHLSRIFQFQSRFLKLSLKIKKR